MKCFDPLLTTAFAGDIGVAREDITPPAGIYARNWGAARHDIADGVHRPLTLTALAISGPAGDPLILISADLGWWMSGEDEWRVRGGLISALGLDPARLIIALSHTHAGPNLYTENRDKPGGALIAPYLDAVRDAAIRAAQTALAARRPARLSWRYGRCDLATNRDKIAEDGKRYILGPTEQPADDTVLVGRIDGAEDGRPLAVLVNYACHPVSLAWQNRLLSPDFVGAMREMIEASVGAPCLFLQGASGELSPAEQNQGEAAAADRNGRRLGHAVLAAWESWPEALLTFESVVESGAPSAVFRSRPVELSSELRASLHSIDLGLKPLPSIAEIEEAWRQCTDKALRERLWRKRGIRANVGAGTTSPTPLWTWRLGEALLIAQPNEAYSSFQRELRARFYPRPVVVLNIANGPYNTYLTPADHYQRDAYQVWVTPFAAGALEKVTAEAKTIASGLLDPAKEGAAPP